MRLNPALILLLCRLGLGLMHNAKAQWVVQVRFCGRVLILFANRCFAGSLFI